VTEAWAKFKLLADPTRFQILAFLREPMQSCCAREDGVCACDLEAFLGLSQPTISHHMKQLVEAGFVISEKRGRWVYYDLNPVAFKALIEVIQPYAKQSSSERAVR
jgi:ArsR family transcriptional regulator